MKIQILDKTKKKRFIEGIEGLGIKKIPQLLIKAGNERVRAYSGNLSIDEIMALWRILPVEGIGLYVGKDFTDRNGVRETRLSVDGMHAWKNQINENILVLTPKQEEDWFHGKNIELNDNQKGNEFVAVKSADAKDFVGVGKIGGDGKILFGFLPKERRRKSQLIA